MPDVVAAGKLQGPFVPLAISKAKRPVRALQSHLNAINLRFCRIAKIADDLPASVRDIEIGSAGELQAAQDVLGIVGQWHRAFMPLTAIGAASAGIGLRTPAYYEYEGQPGGEQAAAP